LYSLNEKENKIIVRAKENFRKRRNSRTRKHGNWRQMVIDAAGICLICWTSEYLEFHEPFGEDSGNGKFQGRMLMCHHHHGEEHQGAHWRKGMEYLTPSKLMDDVNIEIILVGGYDNWVKKFGLIDRIGWQFY